MVPRRLRGLLGVMTTWGIVVATIVSIRFTVFVLSDASSVFLRFLPIVAIRGFIAGAVSGALFAGLLVARERRNTVSTMSLGRVMVWGFLGGASVPVMTSFGLAAYRLTPITEMLVGGVIAGTAGSIIAAAMLRIAQRAPRLPSEQTTPELPAR